MNSESPSTSLASSGFAGAEPQVSFPEAAGSEQCQRIQVELEVQDFSKRVKIRVERYAEVLDWYISGSLEFPLHHLPLLEQALEQMRICQASEEANKIIPFPGAQAPHCTGLQPGC